MIPKNYCFGLCSQIWTDLATPFHGGVGKIAVYLSALCVKWITWSLKSEFDPYQSDQKDKATTALALLRLEEPGLDIKDLYINGLVNEHIKNISSRFRRQELATGGNPSSAWSQVERFNGN